jgi:zinc carboxypeptidase
MRSPCIRSIFPIEEVLVNATLSGLRTAAAVAVLGLTALAGPAAAAVSSQDYHSFAEVERQLQAWSKENSQTPQTLKLLTIGKSAGGRPIYVVRIAGTGPGGDADKRPGVFVGANLAGFHNAGT